MKTKFYLLCVILFGFSVYAHAQMKISNGNVLVGGYGSNTGGNAALSLYSNMSSGSTRVSFNTLSSNTEAALDVFVGKYPVYTDSKPSRLHLHGKDGFYLTNSGGNLMYSTGSSITFEVDAIGTFYTPSDSRFKENVQPLGNTLTNLKELSGISYRLKDNSQQAVPAMASSDAQAEDAFVLTQRPKDTRTRFGFVAQEVKEIYPELVMTDSLGYMYVDYMGVVPLLVNAINELQAEVESQAELIAQLQNNSSQTPQNRAGMSGASDMDILPALYQNTPNPFNTSTVIRFALPYETVEAALYIYDLQGNQIRRIEVSERGEGQVTIQGSELRAGMYIYALIADGKEIDSKRMILTK